MEFLVSMQILLKSLLLTLNRNKVFTDLLINIMYLFANAVMLLKFILYCILKLQTQKRTTN